ncbi:energy-coupling factor transport system ATP-binding protein [Haloactinospora alba]|uniref:Energy-coupling factor transport system ATP-binding protein n=1 Tax=Haloactinospora alba TaxID=405555 RepID=A0A543NG81_9ACTN|nr:ABC transporter ATP-binding protein [Haloactinospora alba]TQN30845.1 energy-coupling factor transport system ATP-binding protein [Haloactinospora alba]
MGHTGARVELSNWGWRYAGRNRWTLYGVDLRIEPGERVLLLGASGSGKSTLLHAMAGLTGPDRAITGEQRGTLRVDGKPADATRGTTGLVGQDPETQLVMARCGDDVAFGLENLETEPARIWPRVRSTLRDIAFDHELDHPTAVLSGGEKQRLAAAGVLAMSPRLLLLDEPTANLDHDGARRMRELLDTLLATTEATMVLVEHRVSDVLERVHRVVVVEPGGGVLADGPPEVVFDRHGDRLAEHGAWVPGRDPEPLLTPEPGGEAVLEATGCRARTPAGLGPHAARPRRVLDGADATVSAGTATAVTGENGSGKSTLLSLLAGLSPPEAGAVRPRGPLARVSRRPLSRWPARQLARHVGTVFQHAEDQFVTGRVHDELRFAPRRAGLSGREADRWAAELLERLWLAPLADAHPFTLSGGEKRRLSVATALSAGPAHAPDVLLLDEPTFGQDTRTWRELVELLDRLRGQGRAIVVATHDELLLCRFAGTELRVRDGGVTALEAPSRPGRGDGEW